MEVGEIVAGELADETLGLASRSSWVRSRFEMNRPKALEAAIKDEKEGQGNGDDPIRSETGYGSPHNRGYPSVRVKKREESEEPGSKL